MGLLNLIVALLNLIFVARILSLQFFNACPILLKKQVRKRKEICISQTLILPSASCSWRGKVPLGSSAVRSMLPSLSTLAVDVYSAIKKFL